MFHFLLNKSEEHLAMDIRRRKIAVHASATFELFALISESLMIEHP